VKCIRSGPGRQVDDAAVEAAELGGRAVAFDLEFLNRINHREERDLARLRLEHGDAVEEVLVRARPSSVDARQRRAGGHRHARGERGQQDEAPAIERQLHDLFVLHKGAETGGRGAKDRRVRRDRHLLADVPDGEIEVELCRLARSQPDTGAPQRPEP
jgi:hypothetical protein